MQLGFSLIPVFLLYSFTDRINGWSRGDVIALGGMFQISMGLLWFGIESNMGRLSRYIGEGELDLVLIRPVSGLFYVMLRWIKPAEIFMTLAGVAVTIAGLAHADAAPGPVGIAQALVLVVCGVVLVSCVWMAIVMSAFWFTASSTVSMVVADVLQSGKYPMSFYPIAVRLFLSFVVPIGFAASFPVEALTGRGSWTTVAAGLVLGALAITALRWWWRFAVRNYSSASS